MEQEIIQEAFELLPKWQQRLFIGSLAVLVKLLYLVTFIFETIAKLFDLIIEIRTQQKLERIRDEQRRY